MMELITLVVALPLTVLNAVVIAEIVAGCMIARFPPPAYWSGAQIAVLIPAHDEELDIATTVRAVLATAPQARVVVIADNCTDGTEVAARVAGAEVIVRHNRAAVGKGHALAFGRAHLAKAPPDYIVLLDADTCPQPGAIEHLVRAAAYRQAVVQGRYWLEADSTASPRVRISTAAFFLTNVIRLHGLDRIAKAAVLTGSGIAAPWGLFARLPLATAHLAEDLMLGIWLFEHGSPPHFAAHADIVGRASSDSGTRTQRDRWEAGRAQVAVDAALRLLRKAVLARSLSAGWIALRLIVPPLSTLAAINAISAMVWAATLVLTGVAWVHPVQPISFLLLVIMVPLSLVLLGRRDLAQSLIHAIPYATWKFGIALARRGKPAMRWQRTDRH